MKGIVKEFSQLCKEHKLLIATIAVIAVPILYAGMFLWAFWDPYDHLADLPIAVVNEDKGATLEDEKIQLGNELVDKLKEDPDFDFHFVQKEKANQGLNNQDYYIAIEIPSDFSKNATTLMDNTPKQLDIIYMPNESYNFLASQIGETAMLQIEAALEEKITETYAEMIFEKIDDVAVGLEDASKATNDLNEGAEDLKKGTGDLQSHLQTLAEKTLEFQNGMTTAKDGSGELTDGSSQLATGMEQLDEGNKQLLQASEEVKAGSDQVANGVSQTNAGMQQLNEKTPELLDGTNAVLDGVKELKKELPAQLAKNIQETIQANGEKLTEGLDELQAGVTSGLDQQLAPALTEGVANQVADQLIASQSAQVEQLATTLLENGVDPQLVKGVTDQLKDQAPTKDATVEMIKESLTSPINESVQTVNSTIKDGFNTYKKEMTNGLAGASDGLDEKIAQAVNPSFQQLQSGLETIYSGQEQLQSGVTKLAEGTEKLNNGAASLSEGQHQYVENMQLFSTKFSDARNGADSLANGAGELFNGMVTLSDGSIQLNNGAVQLKDGALQLNEGMGELTDGTSEFKTEMNKAADDAAAIETDENTYNMMANPVDVKNEKINKVPNYGTGFAPYFLSLGLFVGALLLSIVYPLREPAGIPTSGLNWFFSKFTVLFSVGILQAFIASGFLLLGLGLEVKSVPLFILFAVITSLVFITLIQFLVTCLEDPGRFIAIIILILQLTTSAGTFPLELIPKALQPFNYLLPMTYSVEGFKAVISSGDFSVMWQNAGILLAFASLFILLTISYFIVMFKRKFGSMQENHV